MGSTIEAQNGPGDLIAMANLHTRLFLNATEGLGKELEIRPNEWTNHAAWLAGHLVSTRYTMLQSLGVNVAEPHGELYANRKGIDPGQHYPSLETHREDWKFVSPIFISEVSGLTPDQLAAKAPFPTPMGDTIGAVLGFILHHEAYHLGQLGILRKYFGKEAMQYN